MLVVGSNGLSTEKNEALEAELEHESSVTFNAARIRLTTFIRGCDIDEALNHHTLLVSVDVMLPLTEIRAHDGEFGLYYRLGSSDNLGKSQNAQVSQLSE